MEPQPRNSGTAALGNFIALIVLLWAAFGIYTSFFCGTIPFVSWNTSHMILFGLVWLFFVLPGTMYQVRTLRNCFLSVTIWSHGWSLLPLAVANLVVQTLGILLTPISWFPSLLPGPFGAIHGGILTGLITLVCVIAVLAPSNFALIGYTNWLFREQHAEYLRVVERDRQNVA